MAETPEPEVDLSLDGQDYETNAANNLQDRVEGLLLSAEERVEDIHEKLEGIDEEIQGIDAELEDAEGQKQIRLLRKKQKLLDKAEGLRDKAEEITEKKQEKAVDRIDRKADRLEDRTGDLKADNRRLDLIAAKLEDPNLSPGDQADLLAEKRRLEGEKERKKGRERRAERAKEFRQLEQEAEAEEMLTLQDLEAELEDAYADDGDGNVDAALPAPDSGDDGAPDENTPPEGEGGEAPDDGAPASEEDEGADESKESTNLSDKLSLAAKGMVDTILEDLENPDDVVSQAFVTAKTFLVMLLVGKGGKSASWLSNYSGEQLDLLEKGIGLKVGRESRDEQEKVAKLNDDGGVTVEWIDPEPEYMMPTRAIKVYKDVFGQNWQKTPARDITRATKMEDLKSMAEGYGEDSVERAQFNRLIEAMTAANDGAEVGGSVLVIKFLQENTADVRAQLGVEDLGEEEAGDKEQFDTGLSSLGLTLNSTMADFFALPSTDSFSSRDFGEVLLASYNEQNGTEATAEGFTMQDMYDFVMEHPEWKNAMFSTIETQQALMPAEDETPTAPEPDTAPTEPVTPPDESPTEPAPVPVEGPAPAPDATVPDATPAEEDEAPAEPTAAADTPTKTFISASGPDGTPIQPEAVADEEIPEGPAPDEVVETPRAPGDLIGSETPPPA